MKKKQFIVICISVLFVGLSICFSLLKKNDIPLINTVYVNDLLQQTEQNWNRLNTKSYTNNGVKAENLTAKMYPVKTHDFTVLDLNGTVIFSTIDEQSATYYTHINNAIANRDILVDIIVDKTMVGKLIIKNDISNIMTEQRGQLRQVILLTFLILTVMMLGYYFYLERQLFRPFLKLKHFATSIASGNLDAPIMMDKKNVFGAFSESFDLMRDALKTAKHNEYLADMSKKELVASLSHDIKNPIASIKAICENMALKSDDKHVITIHQKAEQIDILISDMFQSTLEDLGELKVKPDEFCSDILLEIINNVNYYNKIKITSDLPECLILCDKLRLTQIFDNVVGNSYKYAGTDINISFSLDATHLQIYIKDFGRGINEQELPLVWQKFYRGHNSEGKDGSGLGLYLSKLFIEKMGGQIEGINEQDGFLVKLSIKLVYN